MQITGHLDFDLVAVEQEDQLTLMLELVALAVPPGEERPPASVQELLDRSGSMDGAALHGIGGARSAGGPAGPTRPVRPDGVR